jgi:hypothetical protein
MRRILLIALVGAAVAALPSSAVAKPATFKTGTYNAKFGNAQMKFKITLKRSSCKGVPGQGKSSLHLCVALPVSPAVGCTVPISIEVPVGSFVSLVQLPNSGKVTQQAPVKAEPVVPGAGPTTGQSAFSVTFTKKGTASGYLEENLELSVNGENIPCSSGKVPFTAKLS